MTTVFTAYCRGSREGQRNLHFGISHHKWGLRRTYDDVRIGHSFDWHVIGTKAKGLRLSPRSKPHEMDHELDWLSSSR